MVYRLRDAGGPDFTPATWIAPDGTAIVRLQAHTDRLFDAAHIFNMQIPFSKEEINEALIAAAAEGPLKGILAVTNDPLVSIDFNHAPASSTVALAQTQVIDGGLGRVLSWYDNEWGFSTRMSDTALAMAKLI